MANWVFNRALGRVHEFATLPQTNDAFIAVPLETAGLEADATLRDYDDLASLLAGTTNEQVTMGRKTFTAGIAITVDDTNNRVDIDMNDITWVAAAGNAISALILCYDNDTTAGTDANIVPMCKWDFVATPDGSTDIVAVVPATGFYRASAI